MDVVRSEVNALGGRIETTTVAGQGTTFKLVLPLTTAVTQVVMIRSGKLSIGVPANVVEIVRRATPKEVAAGLQHRLLRDGRGPAAVLLVRGLAAGFAAQHRTAVTDLAGGGVPQRRPAHRRARGRSAGQPGSGGEEPRAAARPPARPGRHDGAGVRRRGADLQPGRAHGRVWRAGAPAQRRPGPARGAGARRRGPAGCPRHRRRRRFR